MRTAPAYGLIVAGVTLAACAPVPVRMAERQCHAQFAPHKPVSGEAGMGVATDGFHSKMRVNINLGANMQGDPSAAYDACVYRKSGQMPTRPLHSY